MLSIVEVKCPHCGAEGRIILPPLGTIIIGPCPECQGMVAVFCGKVLALDSEMMNNGSTEDKKEHLMEVLGVFVHDRVEQLFTPNSTDAPEPELSVEEPEFQPDSGPMTQPSMVGAGGPPISEEEVRAFLNVDLKLIDNKEYFRSVFP